MAYRLILDPGHLAQKAGALPQSYCDNVIAFGTTALHMQWIKTLH